MWNIFNNGPYFRWTQLVSVIYKIKEISPNGSKEKIFCTNTEYIYLFFSVYSC